MLGHFWFLSVLPCTVMVMSHQYPGEEGNQCLYHLRCLRDFDLCQSLDWEQRMVQSEECTVFTALLGLQAHILQALLYQGQ